MKQPNLIIFLSDQFRADHLGHLANTAASCTPELDALITKDAVSFGSNFCQNPVCTPSRCSLMSGWYPHVNGHRTMHHMLHDHEQVLLKLLKDQGYYIWWGGKNDFLPGGTDLSPYCSYRNPVPKDRIAPAAHNLKEWRGNPQDPLYYSFLAGEEPATETNGDSYNSDLHHVLSACRFIREYNQDAPYVVFLPVSSPHPPYYAERKWLDQITCEHLLPRTPEPDWSLKPAILKGIHDRQHLTLSEEDWIRLSRTYSAMCLRQDHQVGMILDAMKQAGSYEDTAFFFLSDHGDFTGDYGLVEKTQNTFEDALVHVPMIIKPPSWIPVQAGIRRGLTENIDFFATVLDMTGIAPTHSHYGRSLVPYLAKDEAIRDCVHTEGGRLKGELHCREAESRFAVIEGDLYWPRVGLQQIEDPMYHSKATMLRTDHYKYVRRLYEADELYDLAEDPKELCNVIQNPEYQTVLMELQEMMLTFYQETCDIVPLLPDSR